MTFGEMVALFATRAGLRKVQALAQGAAAQAKQRQLNSDNIGVVTFKPFGFLASHPTSGGPTRSMAFCSTVPFSAVELSYVHLGGNGAATGIIACVAPTDDPGALDYSLGNVVSNKKFIVPIRGGTEYNTLSADGWQAVTWGGASSASAADAGAANISIAQSDVIPCQAIPAANGSGLYWGLVRWGENTGSPRTYGSSYTGIATGTQYNDEAGFAKIFFNTGNSAGAVASPSTLSTANTQTFADSPGPNLMVRLHSIFAARPKTIMTVGDSRFDTVTEPSYAASTGYASFGFKLAKALTDGGTKTHLIRAAFGGLASRYYQQHAMAVLDYAAPNVALYLVYSINDGTPTRTLVDAAKARAVAFVKKCRAKGVQPYLITSYPYGSMAAPAKALLDELDVWAAASGVPYFSPLVQYGTASGDWQPGVSTDGTNHMKQAYYQDMATRVSAAIVGAQLLT